MPRKLAASGRDRVLDRDIKIAEANLPSWLTEAGFQAKMDGELAGMVYPVADALLFVSTAGSDTNSGLTPGKAKKSIQAAIDTLKNAGKHGVVRVGAGVFTEDITLRDGISVIGAGSNMTTIKAPVGSTAPGLVQISDGPVTGMRFEGFRIEGSGNAGQHGLYAFARSSPAPAYPHAGWWYSIIKDLAIVNFLGRAMWLRGGGSTYMLPHQFLTFEMVRCFTSVAANTEALVLSGQVGQIDFIQCEFDSNDGPPYGDVMSVPNIYICPQLNDNGTFADEENPYAITFHTPTIQNGYKAVYATHPSFTEFIAPHLEGFRYGFHADSGAGLLIRGGGFSNVGGWGGGTGYWTNTTIGGMVLVDGLRGGGSKDKAHISDGNLGSYSIIRDSIGKSSPGNETTNLTKQTSVQADASIPLQGNRTVICSTSATAATSITSSAAPGEPIFIEAFGGPLTFSTGNGLRLGGRSSVTIPDGAVAQFVRLDILNNWALVGHTPGANTTVVANYTVAPIDKTILATAGTTGISVTLPIAPRGTRLDVKKTDNGAGAVTIIAGTGNTIEGAGTLVLPNQYDAVALESNGTTWYVLAQMGRVRFRKGSGANALEISDNNDNLRWGFPGATLNGFASNGSSIRLTLDTNDTPTNGRFNSQLFSGGKHASFSNSGTEVFAVAADGAITSQGKAVVKAGDQAIQVKDYGPLGTTDDTATISAALAAASGRRLVFPPNMTLNTKENVLNNASDVIIDGNGCTLQLIGTGTRIAAINVTGTGRNIEIRNLRVKGNAVLTDRHAGIISSGANLTNVRIINCVVEDVTLGISFAADGYGSLMGVLYQGNRVKNVIGTNSGDGYGLHVAISDTVNPSGIRIVNNIVESAQRHSIYCAKSNGAVISNNTLLNHRDANKNGDIRSALMIARSTNVIANGNMIQRPAGGGIMLSGTVGTTVAGPYEVIGNMITDPQDGCGLVYFGQQDPSTEGYPTHVDFAHNILSSTALVGAAPPPLAVVWNGKFLRIRSNIFRLPAGATGTGLVLQGLGVTGNNYMDQIEVAENIFDVDVNNSIRISPGHEAHTTAYRFRGNRRIGAGNLFVISANLTNPNIDIQDQEQTGLLFTGVSTMKPRLAGPAATAAPTAGAGSALPATPAGYLTVSINGTDRQVAYY